MTAQVFLPRLEAFKIVGASPVFKRDLGQKIFPGINLILGGNGLGKTTTMQALAFGLTGGVSQKFEPDRSFRWDHKWFSGRVGESELSGAFVEIVLAFGKRRVGVRRRFSSSAVIAVKIGDDAWIEEREEASKLFAEELAHAGYRTIDDFAFLVHRLLYLAEDRRALAWDASAQARLLMLLSPEAINEEAFRRSRDLLKKTDSKRRHTHVAVGKLQAQLTTGKAETRQPSVEIQRSSGRATTFEQQELSDTELVAELDRAMRARNELEEQLRALDSELEKRSDEVDAIRQRIDVAEVALVQSTLKNTEVEGRLPLAKLLERGICPACGIHQAHLQHTARQHAEHHQCILCGSAEHTTDWAALAELQSELSEKLRAQRTVDEHRRVLKGSLQAALVEEERLSLRVSTQVSLTKPLRPIAVLRVGGDRRTPAEPRREFAAAQREETQLLALVQSQQRRLNRTYANFRNSVTDRLATLRELYSRFATSFLGHECTLVEVQSEDRLFSLNRLVPRFNGVVRHEPESCSEAQQFFLDIALRMAFISLGKQLSGIEGAFFCETPENALDISYVDNVADMFTDFAGEKHSIVLTANIQENGLYQRLLQGPKSNQAEDRVLNLLEFGQLSSVQRRALKELRKHSPTGGRNGGRT